MDATEDETPLAGASNEMKELLGLFDAPAFARRGQDLEHALARLDARCCRERAAMLEMVRLRLKQWAAVATGSETALEVFTAPIDGLWPASSAPPPVWAERAAPTRKLRSVARVLVASLERFNRRWDRVLDETNLDHLNRMIDHYNRYYVLEKECSLGSARLASRYFVPRPRLTRATLLEAHPPLPIPVLKSSSEGPVGGHPPSR
jgi:hypothetical protein